MKLDILSHRDMDIPIEMSVSPTKEEIYKLHSKQRSATYPGDRQLQETE